LKGCSLFGKNTHFEEVQGEINSGWTVDVIELDSRKTIETVEENSPEYFIPVFRLTTNGLVEVLSPDIEHEFDTDDRLVVLRNPSFNLDE